jgi:hypothetical protein
MNPTPHARKRPLRLLVAVALLPFLAACGDYRQDSPETVLATARKMVENQRADLLPDLIYADSKDMRKLLDQLGQTLGSLQDLALAVHKAYPDEIEALRLEAEAAAKDGKATSFIQRLASQATQGQGGRRNRRNAPTGPNTGQDMQQVLSGAAKEVFADPYGWLTKAEDRLTVVKVADDTAAIMWDGKPAFGVGLTMKQDKGKWYLVLPTNAPGLGRLMPKSQEAWEIMGSLVQVFDNMFADLETDVRKGKCKRLEDLANAAGEKAAVPAIMVFIAYGRLVDAERKEARKAAVGGAPAIQVKVGAGSDPKPAAPKPEPPSGK